LLNVNDGLVNAVHHPVLLATSCGRSEVTSRPSVGMVHSMVMMMTSAVAHGLDRLRRRADDMPV